MAALLEATANASVVENPVNITGEESWAFVTSDVTPCQSWQRIVWGALYAGTKLALQLADIARWSAWYSAGDYGKNCDAYPLAQE